MKKNRLLLATAALLCFVQSVNAQIPWRVNTLKDTANAHMGFQSASFSRSAYDMRPDVWLAHFEFDSLLNKTKSTGVTRNIMTYDIKNKTAEFEIETSRFIDGDLVTFHMEAFLENAESFLLFLSPDYSNGTEALQKTRLAEPMTISFNQNDLHINEVIMNFKSVNTEYANSTLTIFKEYLMKEYPVKKYFSVDYYDLTTAVLRRYQAYADIQKFIFQQAKDPSICWILNVSSFETLAVRSCPN